MERIAALLPLLDALVARVGGPLPLVSGAALLLSFAAAALVRRRRPRLPRHRQVAVLAGQGLGIPEIARRTRLSRDAVALALQVERAAEERRNLPSTARIAARETPGESSATFGVAMQVAERQRHVAGGAVEAGRARPLPPRRARTFTLHRTAAWASSPE
jgi:hypothetical protein